MPFVEVLLHTTIDILREEEEVAKKSIIRSLSAKSQMYPEENRGAIHQFSRMILNSDS
jgi:hypothetical protein